MHLTKAIQVSFNPKDLTFQMINYSLPYIMEAFAFALGRNKVEGSIKEDTFPFMVAFPFTVAFPFKVAYPFKINFLDNLKKEDQLDNLAAYLVSLGIIAFIEC